MTSNLREDQETVLLHAPLSLLVCVMVGLPARGKTYTARKIARYLTWMGHRSRIFNVGQYRRKQLGAQQTADFFDPSNEASAQRRAEVAEACLVDMLEWLIKGGATSSSGATPSVADSPRYHRNVRFAFCV